MRDGIEYHLWRQPLPDGDVTTVYAVRYPSRSTRTAVIYFPRTEHLDVWCRRNGVAENTIYRWKSKFGGMEVSEAKRLRELEGELL